MLFNSITFFVFFIIVLVLHNLPFTFRIKKLNLLIASYIFYAAWNPPFVLLLWLSTVLDWLCAKVIHQAKSDHQRKIFFFLSLTANLGLLVFFKYGNFMLDNFTHLLHFLGFSYQPLPMNIILPVGISFYTFQTLSYVLDVYMKRSAPCKSFLDYALYVTFFPQLVAGPIVRVDDFIPQLKAYIPFSFENFKKGIYLLTFGLFQKIFIADFLMAPIVENVYRPAAEPSFLDAWVGTFAFSTQIFCDFSGYTHCAIGTALAMGFTLPKNFDAPYAALGFSDFWKRWHMSLSTWLRDYLYIPLGGNQLGLARTIQNLLITMTLAGLWHGAAWTFALWGFLHAIYLCTEHILRKVFPTIFRPIFFLQCLIGITTYLGICLAWVLFRSTSTLQAAGIYKAMFAMPQAARLLNFQEIWIVALTTLTLLISHALTRQSWTKKVSLMVPWWGYASAAGCFLFLIAAVGKPGQSFIYFQF